jgi:hypothetical protein
LCTQLEEALAKDNNAHSEAWAAYLFTMDRQWEKAVVKIRMQNILPVGSKRKERKEKKRRNTD